MLLTGEVKDKSYQEPPRQQEALYAHSADQYLKSDVQTGQHYYDLNAANKSYAGPWLFGKENVQVFVDNMKAQWLQWCPVPADLRDGVFLRGNVIYENPNGTYRSSGDIFEGVLRTDYGRRYFVGKTQHTFYGRNLPDGSLKVIAQLNIFLNQRLAYNPMMIPPARENENNSYAQNYSQPQNYSQIQNYAQPQNYSRPSNYSQNQQPLQYQTTPQIHF